MNDDHFPDLMHSVGVSDAGIVENYWEIIRSQSESLRHEQIARLVAIAHQFPLSREQDEWFWRPYREIDVAFPVDDAVPLHARLADSALRQRLAQDNSLEATLVRLADLNEWEPVTNLLHASARDALKRQTDVPRPPKTPAPRKVWSNAQQTKLDDLAIPNPITAQILGEYANILLTGVEKGLSSALGGIEALTTWSNNAHAKMSRDQAVTQWVLAGVRSDGTPWSTLPSVSTAIDAAYELADLVSPFPPTSDQESLLALVLSAAHPDSMEPQALEPRDYKAEIATPPPELATFTQAHNALQQPDATTDWPPSNLALRLVWERRALLEWADG